MEITMAITSKSWDIINFKKALLKYPLSSLELQSRSSEHSEQSADIQKPRCCFWRLSMKITPTCTTGVETI
jgi:hypothetical protein